jgi:transcriptional antiterminator NusG
LNFQIFIDKIQAVTYYALQVKTRGEEKYIRLFRALYPDCPIEIYFPRRKLSIRRRGKMVPSIQAVFPGYIFLGVEQPSLIEQYQWQFRKTSGFYRFLKSNQNIMPLLDRDLETALHFIKKTGPQVLADISKVYFDTNARIVVTEGPLSGLEGKIIKVDKRKGRAKIKLDLYGDSFSIDLGFEVIMNAAGPKPRL